MNDNMPIHLVSRIIKKLISIGNKAKNKKALILGATFKENCPDLRNSKVFDIFNELSQYNISSDVFDPEADFEELMEFYGDSAIKSLSEKNNYDILIIAVSHKGILDLDIDKFLHDKSVVFDVKGIFLKKLYLRE